MARENEIKADSLTRADPLSAKLVEVFNARQQLNASVDSMRTLFNSRVNYEGFDLRLLDCALWAQNLAWLITQAHIIVKSQEK